MSKFTVGEYKMRNGWVAHIKYVLPEPHNNPYSLFGYYYNKICHVYQNAWWTSNGKATLQGKHERDLMLSRREVWIPYYPDGTQGAIQDNKPKEFKDVEMVHFIEVINGRP